MPISANTIDAIQVAGASVFEADAALKSAVKEFAAQVHANMLQNPFDVGNDTLFEEWKTVAC
jgi:hypothetical protein